MIARQQRVGILLSLGVSAIFAGNYYFIYASGAYYAEGFLALLVLLGFFMLTRYLQGGGDMFLVFGFSLLGVAALVKNEGIAIYVITVKSRVDSDSYHSGLEWE